MRYSTTDLYCLLDSGDTIKMTFLDYCIYFFLSNCLAITWGIAAIYISIIKKYTYNDRYDSHMDKLKFTWCMLIYASLAFSFVCIDEMVVGFGYKICAYTILVLLTIMISATLFLRYIGNKKRALCFLEKRQISHIGILRAVMIATNIVTVVFCVFLKIPFVT